MIKNKYFADYDHIYQTNYMINYFYNLITNNLFLHDELFDYDFNYGFRIKFKNIDNEYRIVIKDRDTFEIIYDRILKPEKDIIYSFCKKYYINYYIDIFIVENDKSVELLPYKGITFNPSDKNIRVYISNINPSGLGDTIAWIQGVILFEKKFKNVKIHINFSNKEFENLLKYSNLSENIIIDNFNNMSEKDNFYATYLLGCFYNDKNYNYMPEKYQNLSLIEYSTSILGVNFNRFWNSLLDFNFNNNIEIKKPYVCIGTHASSIFKEWLCKDGWNNVIEFLINIGYDVYCIDNSITNSITEFISTSIPTHKKLIHINNKELVDRGKFLSNCDFFIGVSSGLSWLAWMMHKPVILISGFTNAITEFYTPYRVINKYVCNSCWNDHTIKWDPNTTVCPRVKNNISDKNFLICSRSIGYNSVILNIKKLLETKNYGKENSDTY